MMLEKIALSIIIGYLVGCIPTGWILVKILTGHEIRYHGSKNIGFTNVARVINFWLGLVVLIIDIGKALSLIYFLIPAFVGTENTILVTAGAACIIGNRLTFWFKNFKGGKAVATSAGIFFALMPIPLLIALVVWLVIVFWNKFKKRDWKKFVFIASILASIALSLSYFIGLIYDKASFLETENLVKEIFVLLVVVLMIINHISNIKKFISDRDLKKVSKSAR